MNGTDWIVWNCGRVENCFVRQSEQMLVWIFLCCEQLFQIFGFSFSDFVKKKFFWLGVRGGGMGGVYEFKVMCRYALKNKVMTVCMFFTSYDSYNC